MQICSRRNQRFSAVSISVMRCAGIRDLSMFINPWDMDIGGIWWAWWALGTFGIVRTGLLITARR